MSTSNQNSAKTVQQDLTGNEVDDPRPREKPKTLLNCDECGETVLASKRQSHPHELTESPPLTTIQKKQLEETVPETAFVDTETFRITFDYRVVETVEVEARHASEAVSIAGDVRTYDGEILDTIHTEKESVSDPSLASLDYLLNMDILSEDHDITRSEFEALDQMR